MVESQAVRAQRAARTLRERGVQIKQLRKELDALKEQCAEDRELLGRLKAWASGSHTRVGGIFEDGGRCSGKNMVPQRCKLPAHDHHTECEF
jgi:hypothetical protein